MMNHWEKPLKELSAQRMRRRSEGHTEVIEIPDDDCKSVSMDELEKQSLQKAQEGIIIVDGDDLLADDGYANPEEIANGEVPEAMPKPEEKPNTMTEKKATIEEKPEEKPMRSRSLLMLTTVERISLSMRRMLMRRLWPRSVERS